SHRPSNHPLRGGQPPVRSALSVAPRVWSEPLPRRFAIKAADNTLAHELAGRAALAQLIVNGARNAGIDVPPSALEPDAEALRLLIVADALDRGRVGKFLHGHAV